MSIRENSCPFVVHSSWGCSQRLRPPIPDHNLRAVPAFSLSLQGAHAILDSVISEPLTEPEKAPAIWRCFAVRPGEKKAFRFEREDTPRLLGEGARLWIDVEGPDSDDAKWLGDTFGFHGLALTDVLNNDVRPKQETYDEVLFTVFGAINLNPGEEALDTINLNIFLTGQFVVSAHGRPLKTTRSVADAIDKGRNWLGRGPDYVYYRLLDGVINRYLDVMDEMEERFAELERRVFKTQDGSVQEALFREKRRLAYLKRSIGPKRDALRELVYEPFSQIAPETQTLLRDVMDHVMRIGDAIESYRELAGGLMDSYMSQISNRMNEVMKLMSIIATIMLPLSFLTGIFGMNFDVMPGVHFEHGFWGLAVAMFVVALGLLWFFRRRGIL